MNIKFIKILNIYIYLIFKFNSKIFILLTIHKKIKKSIYNNINIIYLYLGKTK